MDAAHLDVFTDVLPVNTITGVAVCPALVLPSPQAIPQAVKHIYSQLAASADEPDEGTPDLVMTLVSDGNTLSQGYMEELEDSLSRVAGECTLWTVTTGKVDDPFSCIVGEVMRRVLPRLYNNCDMLNMIVSGMLGDGDVLVDASANSLLVVCRSVTGNEESTYRSLFASRICRPPPALLIGVHSETAPAILLSPSSDARPLPICIFAGSSTSSLQELVTLLDCGVPVIILEDSCELCVLLRDAVLYLHSSSFSTESFDRWLASVLLPVFPQEDEDTVENAKIQITKLASHESLLHFMDRQEVKWLPVKMLEVFASTMQSADLKRVLSIAAKLNCPSLLNRVAIDYSDQELLDLLISECASKDSRLDFLSALLLKSSAWRVSSNTLLRVLSQVDKHFFCVVMAPLLNCSGIPDVFDEEFVQGIDDLLYRCVSIRGLFLLPCEDFHQSMLTFSIWCLFIHRPSLVHVLVSYCEDPLSVCLLLGKVARRLAAMSDGSFFYEESLLGLSHSLADHAYNVFEGVPLADSYWLLCCPMPGGSSLPEVAFRCGCRRLLAHDSCQRWVHRLLYGRLTFVGGWPVLLLCALLVLPIRRFVSVQEWAMRPPKASPVASFLADIRHPRRCRAMSVYSVVSSRTDLLSSIALPNSLPVPSHTGMNGPLTGESSTPQSLLMPMGVDDIDQLPTARKKFSPPPKNPPSLVEFYTTPIVKYWLSLFFRILYIGLFAYSVLLPGCGSPVLDTIVWVWTFVIMSESLWVISCMHSCLSLREMPWRVFDVCMIITSLVCVLALKVFGWLASDIGMVSVWMRAMWQTGYWPRVASTFLFVYMSYSTVLSYVAISPVFGPLCVRVKLMVLRDFTSFFVLVCLVMLSSAVSISSLAFPDRPLTWESFFSQFGWSWTSVFSTDLSYIHPSEECRKSQIQRSNEFCTLLSLNRIGSCPSQAWPVAVSLMQFLVVLKLLCWPILFAFFAKTAKAVDKEADDISKYQLYCLVREYSLRPPLPPPFTPLYFFFIACFRRGINLARSFDIDHPDMVEKGGPHTAYHRSHNIPQSAERREMSRRLSMLEWKRKRDYRTMEDDRLKSIQNHVRMMAFTERDSLRFIREEYVPGYTRLVVPEALRPWSVPVPQYSPPSYSRPVEEFSPELQAHVDSLHDQALSDTRQQWRNRQFLQLLQGQNAPFSPCGLPLNPRGRMGVQGRGTFAKFGPNLLCAYVITNNNKVLLEGSSLPRVFRYDTSTRDEYLAGILRILAVPESDIQMMSLRVEGGSLGPTHVLTRQSPSEYDTDNAWRENDIWRLEVGAGRPFRVKTEQLNQYQWVATDQLHNVLRKEELEICRAAV